jgi:protein-S-isoprenylcysteine O-methyltransferase Ste14
MSYVIYEIILHRCMELDLFCFRRRFSFESPAWLDWSPHWLLNSSWLLFAVFWLIAAFRSKTALRREGGGQRLVHIIIMVIGFVFLYDSAPAYLNWLNRRFLPDERWIVWFGAWLTLAGVLFAIWARTTIRKECSAEIQIKEGHKLVRSGAYAHFRHPIYTCLLIAIAGTALAIGACRALLALAIVCVGFARKAKKEESFLAAQFGPAFEEYRRRTGFFLPRLS